MPIRRLLFGLGLYRLLRSRHPRPGGMRVGFLDLVIGSFLTASAHGAGLVVRPPFLTRSAEQAPQALLGLLAAGLHSAAYLLVTGLVAVLVYERLGLRLLRSRWYNL